jgi:hypothetical protein
VTPDDWRERWHYIDPPTDEKVREESRVSLVPALLFFFLVGVLVGWALFGMLSK